ncbi:MAG: hypothetical protein JW726_12830 [Anaerolineales bacterium]|nr:hypothetical protein [Anaerolineales bacterium]
MALRKFRLFAALAILLAGLALLVGPEQRQAEAPLLLEQALNGVTSARAASLTGTLFEDDFEGGTRAWNLDGDWQVSNDGGDLVLDGSGHAWSWLKEGQNWTDYTASVDVKLISGAAQLMFRFTEDHGRYILGVTPGGLYLRREAPWGKISSDLATDATHFAFNTWYTISIDADVNRIRVSVDGAQRMDYTNPSWANQWPLWQGTLGLEVTGGASAQAYFNNANVYGVIPPDRVWVRTGGPIGGLGYDVRFGASTQEMYVTDNYSGVFKSSNNGSGWYPSNRGITGRFAPSGDAIPVFTLNVDPNDVTIIWAGLKDVMGVFRSQDSGMTWEERTPSSTVLTETLFVFRGFTAMPGDSDIVFATGEIPSNPTDFGKEFDRVGGRVLRSDDGGLTWTSVWKGPSLTRYTIVRPDNHNVIYVSTGIFDREADNSDCGAATPVRGGVGILRGVYNNTTHTYAWTVLNQANGLADLYVGSLVMHPTNPDILLAGTGNNACSYNANNTVISGVFITDDGGDTWHHTLTNEIITSVEFAPSNPQIAYAGGKEHFYISRDSGWSWEMVAGQSFPWGPDGISAGFPIDFLVDPSDPDIIFANNYGGGNVVSEDGGVTWSLASQGYTGAILHDVEIHPDRVSTVYTAGKSGVFRSRTGGASWEGLTYSPATLFEVYSVALDPDHPDTVLSAHDNGGSMFRSTDGGYTWNAVLHIGPAGGGSRYGFKRIIFAPSNSNIVYAGSCMYHVDLVSFPSAASYGIFKSTDNGVNWQSANDGQTADTCVNNLAIHPTNPNIVYIATAYEGVYKTTDGGASWTQLSGLPVNDVRSIAIHPQNPNIVYVGLQYKGVYISSDGGASWNPLIAGMEPNDSIWAIIFDPANPDTVYAGSHQTGVYQWLPDESRWTHINLGLRTRAVTDLAISSDGSVLYASTYGEGIFRLGDVPIWRTFLPMVGR